MINTPDPIEARAVIARMRMPASAQETLDKITPQQNLRALELTYRGTQASAQYEPMFRQDGWYRNLEEAATDKGVPQAMDGVTLESLDQLARRHEEATYRHVQGLREGWRALREDIGARATRAAVGRPDQDGQSWFKQTLRAVLGSDAMQITMGGFEPFMRAQQVMYGVLKGEGWAAFSRLFPSVVLENNYDEDGNPIEISPFAASLDAAWAKISGGDYEEKLDILHTLDVHGYVHFQWAGDVWSIRTKERVE